LGFDHTGHYFFREEVGYHHYSLIWTFLTWLRWNITENKRFRNRHLFWRRQFGVLVNFLDFLWNNNFLPFKNGIFVHHMLNGIAVVMQTMENLDRRKYSDAGGHFYTCIVLRRRQISVLYFSLLDKHFLITVRKIRLIKTWNWYI
jgi:hypothetical protein